ncbi:MAG: bifunctional UDP-3-O-[3-hydroxymyristoyl] N-acetylglucosamine deacetylase/3-hydroxyacyl-ACP dehydratase, partial [Bacteroidota bacterium]
MFLKQHTLKNSASVSGVGLHTGKSATLTFKPAAENHGLVFQRIDLEGKPQIPADVDLVVDTQRGTTLGTKEAKVHTVEHVMAALAGMQLDNVLIELDGPEPPIMDGSAMEFIHALSEAGLAEQAADREIFVIDEAIQYAEQDREVELAALPSPEFRSTVMIDFNSESLHAQHAILHGIENFSAQIADSRTFCFLHELAALRQAGLIKGGSLESALVFVEKEVPSTDLKELMEQFGVSHDGTLDPGLLNPEGFRHSNEPARHKLLDLIGDLALVGMPVQGHIMAARPGHKANVELAKRIKAKIKQQRIARRFQKDDKKGVIFDINAIAEILPHRYPFLLVDKILDFTETTITGVKNVTINEPFFQGHFPGNPIMPGVLIVEAMGQVGGILLLNIIENPQSIWVYFVAFDNVRFKKPVIPGDTLVMELEMTALKRSICKMTGKAYVDG